MGHRAVHRVGRDGHCGDSIHRQQRILSSRPQLGKHRSGFPTTQTGTWRLQRSRFRDRTVLCGTNQFVNRADSDFVRCVRLPWLVNNAVKFSVSSRRIDRRDRWYGIGGVFGKQSRSDNHCSSNHQWFVVADRREFGSMDCLAKDNGNSTCDFVRWLGACLSRHRAGRRTRHMANQRGGWLGVDSGFYSRTYSALPRPD